MAASTSQITGNVGLVTLSVDPLGGVAFAPIAELTGDPTAPAPTSDTYETTNTDITDGYKTFKIGWADGGESSYTVNYREDSYSQLLALVGVDASWQLTWTDPTDVLTDPTLTFDGAITSGPSPNMAEQDRWTIDFTIKVSGAPVFVEGTAA